MPNVSVNDHWGRWTVLSGPRVVVTKTRGSGKRRWLCLCACGEKREVCERNLIYRRSLSCGCLRRENASAATKVSNRKHGESGSHCKPEYYVWKTMKDRCQNPNSGSYKRYGGRGIKVCQQWSDSYESFLQDVGRRPTSKHTLERIDNDGSYEPVNVKWATRREQCLNRRSNTRITYSGVTLCVAEWAARLDVPAYLLWNRIYRGWSVERTLSTPQKRKEVHV